MEELGVPERVHEEFLALPYSEVSDGDMEDLAGLFAYIFVIAPMGCVAGFLLLLPLSRFVDGLAAVDDAILLLKDPGVAPGLLLFALLFFGLLWSTSSSSRGPKSFQQFANMLQKPAQDVDGIKVDVLHKLLLKLGAKEAKDARDYHARNAAGLARLSRWTIVGCMAAIMSTMPFYPPSVWWIGTKYVVHRGLWGEDRDSLENVKEVRIGCARQADISTLSVTLVLPRRELKLWDGAVHPRLGSMAHVAAVRDVARSLPPSVPFVHRSDQLDAACLTTAAAELSAREDGRYTVEALAAVLAMLRLPPQLESRLRQQLK